MYLFVNEEMERVASVRLECKREREIDVWVKGEQNKRSGGQQRFRRIECVGIKSAMSNGDASQCP